MERERVRSETPASSCPRSTAPDPALQGLCALVASSGQGGARLETQPGTSCDLAWWQDECTATDMEYISRDKYIGQPPFAVGGAMVGGLREGGGGGGVARNRRRLTLLESASDLRE